MARQQLLDEVAGPPLEGLGQHRVVGVGARLHHHGPGLAREGGVLKEEEILYGLRLYNCFMTIFLIFF